MSYTPQAGDVIQYRGSAAHRVKILGDTSHESTMHIEVSIEGVDELTVESKDVLREMVAEGGWTLVSRKEVEDGKRD